MKVLEVFTIGFDILVDCVRGNAADLYKAIVLDEDGVAGEVAMNNRLLARQRQPTSRNPK